ncbi:MAG: hypothetical protein NW226_22115 [Microscillaceae bacterium]|nr:hypothetical protein [Microscillaceae bacterium]
MAIKTIDLLHKILDFVTDWAGTSTSFHPQALQDTKPAYMRLLQIEALLEAFQLNKNFSSVSQEVRYHIVGTDQEFGRQEYLQEFTHLDYFMSGEFLHDRAYQDNHAYVIQQAVQTALSHFPGKSTILRRAEKPVNLKWMFNHLFRYRRKIHPFTKETVGFLEGFDVGAYFAQVLETELNLKIKREIIEIDHILSLIMDPQERCFGLDFLVEKFEYPHVDLDSLDWEWRVENF